MSDQPISEADVQAYVDGRLPDERRSAVEAWLAARPEESERIAAYRRLAHEVRSAYETTLAEPVPPRLRQAAARGGLGFWGGRWRGRCRRVSDKPRRRRRNGVVSPWWPAGLRSASRSARPPAGMCGPNAL